MLILRLGLTFVAFAVGAALAIHRASAHSLVCSPTAVNDRLTVVGPMAGTHPIWLVDGSSGHWQNADPVKSLWVLARHVRPRDNRAMVSPSVNAGSFRVQGRRLDGPGVIAFQDGIDAARTDRLVIDDPGTRSVMPGGASGEVMWLYNFIPTYLIYPSPGCWELTGHLGGNEVKIVMELKPEMP